MHGTRKLERWAWLGLAILMASQLWIAVAWLARDTRPLFWDMNEHAVRTLKVRHILQRSVPPLRGRLLPETAREAAHEHPRVARVVGAPIAGLSNLVEAYFLGAARPPAAYLPAALALGASDASSDQIAAALGTLWLLALIASVYLLGSAAGGPGVGLLAAVIASAYPMLFGQARQPMLDVPLAALVTLALWALLRCDDLRDSRYSLLLGVLCGVGLLTKQPFPVFVGPALAWAGWKLFAARRRAPDDVAPRLRNARLALFGGGLVAGPWILVYGPAAARFFIETRSRSALEGDPSSLSLAGALYYPQSMVEHSLGPCFALLALIGVAELACTRDARERAPILWAFAGAVLFFGLVHSNKDPRYITPLLPLLAVASARAVARITPASLRTVAAAAIVVLAALTLLGTSTSPARSGSGPLASLLDRLAVRSFYAHPPSVEDWPAEPLLRAIESHRGPAPGEVELLVLEGDTPFADLLTLLAAPDRMRFRDGLPTRSVKVLRASSPGLADRSFYLLVAGIEGSRPSWAATLGFGPERDERAFQILMRRDGLPRGARVELFHYAGAVGAGEAP